MIALEVIESYNAELSLPQQVAGVQIGAPDVTTINIMDDDGVCVCVCVYVCVRVCVCACVCIGYFHLLYFVYKSKLNNMSVLSNTIVVVVEFGRTAVTVNESEEMFIMCVIKDKETVQPIQLEIQDMPNTAERNSGQYTSTQSMTMHDS